MKRTEHFYNAAKAECIYLYMRNDVFLSMRYDIQNNLFKYLSKYYSKEDIEAVTTRYFIGVTRTGDAIFPQMDVNFICRTAKVMQYDPETGHRIKDAKGKIKWLHNNQRYILPDDWELRQCFFGEHLLSSKPYKNKAVCIVEAEKTALIMSMELPQYLWMASGGKSNLSVSKAEVLRGRKVILYPDVDGFSEWEKIAEELREHGIDASTSDYLKKTATEAEKAAKIDIADRVLQSYIQGAKTRENASKCDFPDIPRHVVRILKEVVPFEYQGELFGLIQDLDLTYLRRERINC